MRVYEHAHTWKQKGNHILQKKTNRGASLAIQWLELCRSTTGGTVPSLVGKQRPHLPRCMAKEKKKKGTGLGFAYILIVVALVISHSFETPWTIDHQAPLCMGFSRQEYWSGLPFPSPGIFPNPHLLHWQADSLPLSHRGSLHFNTLL